MTDTLIATEMPGCSQCERQEPTGEEFINNHYRELTRLGWTINYPSLRNSHHRPFIECPDCVGTSGKLKEFVSDLKDIGQELAEVIVDYGPDRIIDAARSIQDLPPPSELPARLPPDVPKWIEDLLTTEW